MKTITQAFAGVGAAVPTVLLPAPGVDLSRFAVVACDQFSAQPDYWRQTEELVGDAPSALRMMLPEAYLAGDNSARVAAINQTMRRYLREGVLRPCESGLIFVRRRTSSGVRSGLLIALDLEQYDITGQQKMMIRATEGTILERLPPRVQIRRDALLEMPHVMVLLDDRENRLMDLLRERQDAGQLPCLYDFALMQRGGHLQGYLVSETGLLSQIAGILQGLLQSGDGLLYAMGDGNHSFATAKACWEEIKPTLSEAQCETHPARYSLVELVSLHDPALQFEPIHRLLFGVDAAQVQREVGFDAENPLPLQELQPMLDAWLANHPEATLEYIHGADQCRALASQAPDRLAVVFDHFDRDTLFETVRQKGALVRKSFSMGEARDKRYYLECREIRTDRN